MNNKRQAFTLAENATHVDMSDGYRKTAFTLAEVLITLGIIGVVAALTIPGLMRSLNFKIKENQVKVIERKINQGTEQMQANGGLLVNYDTTMDFVKELSKTLKIITICDSEHLTDCWGYDEIVTNKNAKPYKISLASNGSQAFHKTTGYTNYKESVGIVLGNGIPMIISYNKKCELLDPDTKYDAGATSACISAVYDINGKKGPNTFGKDVVGFNAWQFGGSCLPGIDDVCFTTAPFKPSPISISECRELKDELGIQNCLVNSTKDYWAGAVKACGGVDHMPSYGDIKKLEPILYKNDKYNANSDLGYALGLKPKFNIFLKGEVTYDKPPYSAFSYGEYPFIQNALFKNSIIDLQEYTRHKSNSTLYAICVD